MKMGFKLSVFWRKHKKRGGANYQFFKTDSGGAFFPQNIRNFGLLGKV